MDVALTVTTTNVDVVIFKNVENEEEARKGFNQIRELGLSITWHEKCESVTKVTSITEITDAEEINDNQD